MVKQSEFDPLATPDTGDYIDALEALGGGLYRNVKILKENLLVNSSDLTFLNGKGVFAGTTLNDLAYFGSRDIDGNVNVAHITAVSANAPYALFAPTCFFTAGASLGAFTGHISRSTTAVGNITTTETDLATFTLPANQLNTTNRGVRVKFRGYSASSLSTKTVRFYVGGSVLTQGTLTLTVSNINQWEGVLEIIRTGSNTQLITGESSKFGVLPQGIGTTAALTESGTIIVKVTGQASGTGPATNDIVAWQSSLEHI